MAQDWKDLLASLKPDGEEPSENINSEEKVLDTEKDNGSALQREPLRVILDKKGRKGKMATIIEGFELDDDQVALLASELKKKIGCGGSSRGGEILIQGDCRQTVVQILRDKGFNVKT